MKRRYWAMMMTGEKLTENELFTLLEERADFYNRKAFIEPDPISIPHRFSRPADIEIAASDGERQQGLMWRSKMDEDHGMLFIFDREEPQSFWMRNTILPLDILFIGADSSINTIYKFTVPYSDQTLPAKENSMFVVEMNAGYCDRHKVKEGDKIRFTRNSPSL